MSFWRWETIGRMRDVMSTLYTSLEGWGGPEFVSFYCDFKSMSCCFDKLRWCEWHFALLFFLVAVELNFRSIGNHFLILSWCDSCLDCVSLSCFEGTLWTVTQTDLATPLILFRSSTTSCESLRHNTDQWTIWSLPKPTRRYVAWAVPFSHHPQSWSMEEKITR